MANTVKKLEMPDGTIYELADGVAQNEIASLKTQMNNKSDVNHNHDNDYDAKGAANTALNSAKSYADGIKNELLNGAGAAYDTLKELGDLIDDNTDAIEALETIASNKADASALSNYLPLTGGTMPGNIIIHNSNPHLGLQDTTGKVAYFQTHDDGSGIKAGFGYGWVTSLKLDETGNVIVVGNISENGVALSNKYAAKSHTHTVANITDLTATAKELNYMDGVTSNVQTQLNGKAASSHTHSYASSSSVGGAATSANKLNTNAGDSNTPVYFANGVPVACTSLDLNTSGNAATATNVAWSGVTSKPTYYDAKAIKAITRSGTTFTYTCMDGTTGTFTQQDNNTTYGVATTASNGLMSSTDKAKLDGIAAGAEVNVQSDWNATSGDAYIKNKPTIPTKVSQLTNDSGYITSASLPTVNNGTLTIQRNGTNITTFSANQSGNATANISVPTKVSQLTNDSGYITSASLPTVPTNYVTTDTDQTISGTKTFTGGMKVSGRYTGSGDDEGIVIGRAENNYAGLCLGDPGGVRSVFYLLPENKAVWRYNSGSGEYNIYHPGKSGTIALTSDIPSLPAIQVVSSLPSSPDSSTLYFITG